MQFYICPVCAICTNNSDQCNLLGMNFIPPEILDMLYHIAGDCGDMILPRLISMQRDPAGSEAAILRMELKHLPEDVTISGCCETHAEYGIRVTPVVQSIVTAFVLKALRAGLEAWLEAAKKTAIEELHRKISDQKRLEDERKRRQLEELALLKIQAEKDKVEHERIKRSIEDAVAKQAIADKLLDQQIKEELAKARVQADLKYCEICNRVTRHTSDVCLH